MEKNLLVTKTTIMRKFRDFISSNGFWLQIIQFRHQGRLTVTNYIHKTNYNKKLDVFHSSLPKHAASSYSTPMQTTWTLRCDLFSASTELVGGSARSSLILFLLCSLCPVSLLLFAKGQFLAPAHSSVLMTLQNTSTPKIKCHLAGSGDTNSTVFKHLQNQRQGECTRSAIP